MGMSREFAEAWADKANIGIIIAAVIGVVSTTLAIWTGNVKEDFLKRDLAEANARGEEAKSEAAKANEKAASLEKEAAVARLEQERLKQQLAWREVTSHQAEAIRNTLKKANLQVTIFWIAGDAEGSAFARRLAEALLNAGSTISAFAPMGMLGAEKHGLSISGSEKQECELLATALRAARIWRNTNRAKPAKTGWLKVFCKYLCWVSNTPSASAPIASGVCAIIPESGEPTVALLVGWILTALAESYTTPPPLCSFMSPIAWTRLEICGEKWTDRPSSNIGTGYVLPIRSTGSLSRFGNREDGMGRGQGTIRLLQLTRLCEQLVPVPLQSLDNQLLGGPIFFRLERAQDDGV